MLHKNRLPVVPNRMAKRLWYGLFFLLLCMPGIGNAQIIHPAVQSDVPIAPSAPAPYMNSALIDCSAGCSVCGINQLSALVFEQGVTGNSRLVIDDHSGIGPKFRYQLPVGAHFPDVAIGNYLPNSFFYYVGVVYTMITGGTVDVYLITMVIGNLGSPVGPTPLLINPPVQISTSGNADLVPHIDVIGSYFSPQPNGLATCDQYVIAWTEHGATPGVNLYYSSFNAPATFTPIQDNLGPAATGKGVDVAGVERLVSGVPTNYAIYTYVDAGGNLWKNEVDLGSPIPLPLPVFQDAIMATTPRIDAIDNYNFNNPGGTMAYYDVVDDTAFANHFVYPQMKEYNNLTLLTNGRVFTSPPFPVRPTVTVGPFKEYTVSFYSQGATPTVYTNDFAWVGGGPNINYYEVNMTPIVGPTLGTYTAISGSCNSFGIFGSTQYLYECWWNNGVIFDKIQPNPVWKPAAVGNVNETASWSIGPNPAINVIRIINNGSTPAAGSYTISDIAGRVWLKGNIQNNVEYADVSKLSPGMYLVSVYEAGDKVKTEKVVKE